MKEWPKASVAYEQAATSFANDAYARVLGGAFASRTLDAQGRFDDSLSAATTALNSWDADYGFEYSIRSSQAPLSGVTTGPVVDTLRVTRDDLAARVATLDHDLRQSGGRLLARGRWQLDQNQFTEAINRLTTFLKQEPGSPALTEARSLLHRAQLESALDLAAVEGAHYDPAKAVAALDGINKEPFDSFVATAALAKAALKLTQGQSSEAEALMGKTLDSWVTTQRDLNRQPPISGIDADVAEIRQVVFRPLGDLPIYGGSGWNAFNFPAALPRFIVLRADVQVKTRMGKLVGTPYIRGSRISITCCYSSPMSYRSWRGCCKRSAERSAARRPKSWKRRISQSAIRCKSFRYSGGSSRRDPATGAAGNSRRIRR